MPAGKLFSSTIKTETRTVLQREGGRERERDGEEDRGGIRETGSDVSVGVWRFEGCDERRRWVLT